MKRTISLLILSLFIFHHITAQSLISRWQYDWGGSSTDYISTVMPLSGNKFLCAGISSSNPGCTKSSINYGGIDIVLFMLDDNGNKLWEKSYGGNQDDYFFDIEPVPSGGYIMTGYTKSGPSGIKTSPCYGDKDIWVLRLDDNGNLIWENTYGDMYAEYPKKILPLSDGGFLVTGEAQLPNSNVLLQFTDVIAMKLDSNGNQLWSKTYGGIYHDWLQNTVQMANGNFLLAAFTTSPISNTKTAPSLGGSDQWVICIQPDGTLLWNKTYGSSDFDYPADLMILNDGNYLLTGIEGEFPGVAGKRGVGTIRKIDAQGNVLWVQSHPSALFTKATQAANGDIYVASYLPVGTDFQVAIFDASGNYMRDIVYGGNNADYPFSIAVKDRDILVAGETYSTKSGNKTVDLCSGIGIDGWIIRLTPQIYIQAPTPAAVCINTSNFYLHFTANTPNHTGNVFTAQLSAPNGSFTTFTDIGSLSSNTSGIISASLPPGLPAGDKYTIRVIASLPADTSSGYSITINPQPKNNFNNDTVLCYGSARTLSATTGYASYLWYDGQTGSTHTVSASGEYWVQITDNNGCITHDTATIKRLLPLPAGFLPPDTSLCSYEDLTLRSTVSFQQYAWSTGDANTSIMVNQPGWYWLQATDQNGCTGTDSIHIATKDCLYGFFMPTAFTPNNDGKNEWCQPRLFGRITKYHFIIFNRWGQKVFDSNDHTRGWDGKINGQPAAVGSYVWSCSYQLENKTAEHKKGTVMLIR
jgi:gliding motility-associated-like protein